MNTLRTGLLMALLAGRFATHPSTAERVERLKAMTGQPATASGPWA